MNGNTDVENSSRDFIYNQNQRLIAVVDSGITKGDYVYNGNGQRVKKVVNGIATIFHYDLQGKLIAESDAGGNITSEYVYLNGSPLAKLEGIAVYYYHNDHLGTPQKMTDSSGQVVWEGDFKPFGEAISITGTITNNLRFPGQYYDSDTGLNYNYFRDYNPVIGRYVQADPIGLMGGINSFVYVLNNPTRFRDPLGLEAILDGGFVGVPDPHATPGEISTAIAWTLSPIAITGGVAGIMGKAGFEGIAINTGLSVGSTLIASAADPNSESIGRIVMDGIALVSNVAGPVVGGLTTIYNAFYDLVVPYLPNNPKGGMLCDPNMGG